ncbi:transmembrane region and signal peptide prediction [Novosphingobium nitrogenifigens DSM 19370]|uniref:Transmembrane region and signal peptide prediction n=1 Tax=Novosphingobium nitrogenifigens DSM 19370 TaxID=983920 RepID=F1Z4Y1_9SPHN|nr:GlsB/YeaQ/YmgE family stress response membrane protein [Novosphingobium nitrogenifigens]EGD60084.1 transmembrane region and signal peptide prediction [Novosphingobium nitrogenifigens DSM 19370]
MLNIVSLVLGGLLIGIAARFFYPAAIPMGLGHTILLGIGGSLVAGFAASWRDGRPFSEGLSRAGCIASVIGAMLLIFIGRHF